MKKSVLLIVFLLLTIGFGEFAQAQIIPQTDPARLLANPRRAAHTFVHWQMKGHERFELSALTMMAKQDLSDEEKIDRSRQLLKILDSRGLLINFDVIPMDPAYEDTLSGLNQYILFNNLPQVYLVKKDSLWMFSEATIDAIPDLYRDTFSIFVDVVLDNLPPYLHREWLGFYIWQYIALFLWLLFGLVLRKIAEYFMEVYAKKLTAKTETQWDDYIVVQTEKPISFLLMMLFFSLTYSNLMLSVNVNYYMKSFLDVAISLSVVWLFYGLVNVLSDYFAELTAKTESKLDEQLVPLVRKSLKIFVIVIGLLFIIQNSGYNVASVLAGLGLGGLAFALAAKDTLANFFGSITIFLDKPFQIGQWINVNGQEGIVEEVGFRSTRIRTFYNSLISIPNSVMANTAVDNLGLREFRRIRTVINLTYSTPPAQLEAFVEGCKAIVHANPFMRKDFVEIHFNNFGPHSLDVLIYVFLKVPNWSEELQQRHNFFMEILKLAKEVGVEFAFPTQTLHIDSFYKEQPRKVGKEMSNEQLADSVWEFGPNGKLSNPSGAVLYKDGKEVDFNKMR